MLTHDGLTIPMDMAGTTAPVKVWLPEWEIEAAASAQLRNIAEPVSYTHLTLPTNREV